MVDLVDDLQVSGQQGLQQIHGPALQSFREDCVVGVGKSARGKVPGLQRKGITSNLSCAVNTRHKSESVFPYSHPPLLLHDL